MVIATFPENQAEGRLEIPHENGKDVSLFTSGDYGNLKSL